MQCHRSCTGAGLQAGRQANREAGRYMAKQDNIKSFGRKKLILQTATAKRQQGNKAQTPEAPIITADPETTRDYRVLSALALSQKF